MQSLVLLETAVLKNDSQSVADYLSDIDRRTANAAMQDAGKAFGFPTMLANGTVWTSMGMLASIFGYTSTNGVGNLIEKYQLTTSKIGWFPFQMGSKMRATFNLADKDSKAVFVTWDTFLVLGMCGRGEKADKVKLYLLEAEKCFRIGIATEAGLSIAKADMLRLKLVKEGLTMIWMIDKMKDGYFKLSAIEAFETVTGKEYPGPKQMCLDFIGKDRK